VTASVLPPFKAEVVGSLLRPAAIFEARDGRAQGRVSADELWAVETRAIEDAVALQRDAGLKVCTDGEFRRRHWFMDFIERIEGVGFEGSLPTRFHNETGDTSNDRLAGTLTDAVVVSLAENPAYGVIGNSPLLVTDRIFQDVSRIGTALNAEYVLLGQLQKGDAGLVTRAHFIRVSDQKHLWAGTITLPATNMEQVVTRAVAEGVGIGLSRAGSTAQTR